MIIEELKNIVLKSRQKNTSDLYIRSLLKEYLQVYVLNFIYLSSKYNRIFVFTGGTCLRHCFGLNRLSEDLDFDLEKEIDVNNFVEEIYNYFNKEYLYRDLQVSVLQKGKQVLLKFPVLYQLGLAKKPESDLLHVKIDLSAVVSNKYEKLTSLKSLYNFNYIVIHYDLSSMMANKIVAILTRNRQIGKENPNIIKGRDYFDLLWFLEKNIMPNLPRINDLMNKKYTLEKWFDKIDKKIELACTKQKNHLKQDLIPFVDNPLILSRYVDSYSDNYERLKQLYL